MIGGIAAVVITVVALVISISSANEHYRDVVGLKNRHSVFDGAASKPFTGTPDPGAGLALFTTNCASCHQIDGGGMVGLAPSIRNRDFLALASDHFIKKTVNRGRDGTAMVARPDLSDGDLTHIIAYLRSLEVANPVQVSVDWEAEFAGDHYNGEELFGTFCASCHGRDGEGYSSGGSGPGIGLPSFLRAASDDYIMQTLRRGRIGTPMRPFIGAAGLANLTEQDGKDIIAHLRANSERALNFAENAPVRAAKEPNPADGEKLFRANCASCHQIGGVGLPGLAPSIRNRDFLAIASDNFIRATVAGGRPGTAMVARPDLAGSPLSSILLYLRDLEIANPVDIVANPDRVCEGNTANGKALFTRFCASCHGPAGEGYSAGGSGPGIGLTGFLSVATDDYIYQTIHQGRIGTAMMPMTGSRGLANLEEQEVNDIIVYLRSLQSTSI